MLTVFQHVECFLGAQREMIDENITPDMRFVEDLGLTSIDTVDLIILCEQDFGIPMPEDEVEQLQTVGALVDYITQRVGDKRPAGGDISQDEDESAQRVE
jgi:acyl carrier protein